ELRRLGVPLWPSVEWRHPAVRAIAGRLWPAVFALAAVQVTVLVNTLLASLLPQGTVSYLYYADRVMEFPLGVFGIALATAALPGYAVGLPAFSATRLAAQTFYALGDTRTPVWAGLVSVAANIALALLLMWPLKHAGLALASSLSAYINLALLYWLLRRRLGRLGSRETLQSVARTAAASSALLLGCLWAGPRLGAGWPGAAWTGGALIVGVIVYGAVAAVLRAPVVPGVR